jgi:transcription antitermination protein NusB
MQAIFNTHCLQEQLKPGEAEKILQKNFEQSRKLLTYLIYFLTELCRYSEKDAKKKSMKNLPTAADLNVSTKIAGNLSLWRLLEGKSFQQAVAHFKPAGTIDEALLKQCYNELCNTGFYQQYIALEARDKQTDQQILLTIFNEIMMGSEAFENHIVDHFYNWMDDGEMILALVQYLIQKPESLNLMDLISNEKKEFAFALQKTVDEKKATIMELIKPKLKNWETDRVATLDMILMQMGVAELLYFETIPAKVTINEYIDLAKEYSTAQSGHFVNGILDNIHKDLLNAGKLHKVDFRKK